VIVIDNGGSLARYNWVGYFAIAVTVVCIFLGSRIKSVEQLAADDVAIAKEKEALV
jgi:hypothetical protein